MKPIITAITLLNAPVDFNRDAGRTAPVAVDYEVHLRAINTTAFFGAGGEFNFDLIPVQTPDAEQFVISKAFRNIDAPVTAEPGWMMLRDGVGNSAVIFVDADTTLQSLCEALADQSDLDIAVGIASDTRGYRLVVAFDAASLSAFEDGESTFLPAPSLSTRAAAVFPSASAVAFPAKTFEAVQGHVWPVDIAAAVSSDRYGPLRMTSDMVADFSSSDVPMDDTVWDAFLDLSAPIFVDGRWLLEPAIGDEDLRQEMNYDTLRSWRQRGVVFMAENYDGEWMAIDTDLSQVSSELGIDPLDYGLIPPVAIDMP